MIKNDKLIDKLVKRNYNNQLEEVLTEKMFKEDVKNLLLDILYKVETSYKDYAKVKQNVLPKDEYIKNIINAVKNDCDSIEFMSPNLQEDNARTFIINKEKKEIKCYPIARKLLYCLSKIQKDEEIVKTDIEFLDKALTNMLNIGNNINTVESLRDFNGFSWNISRFEIENLYYNLIYQDLIILLGNQFLEEWTNKNQSMIEYMALFEHELEKKYGMKIAIRIIELLKKLSILLEFNINEEFKDEMKNRKDFVEKHLDEMSNREKYLEKLCKKRKKIERQIKDIDLTINNEELLRQKYITLNNELPLEKKIFSTRLLAQKMLKEKEKLRKQLKEYNELMNPSKFKAKKEKMQNEYKYLILVDTKDLDAEILRKLILLQKNILRALIIKIENVKDKQQLFKIMYEIRYFCLLPIMENKNIKDIYSLSNLIDEVITIFINKAYEMNLLNKICQDKEQNISILKHIFLLQIISLEDIQIKILKNEGEFCVQYYDEDIADEKFKIDSTIVKDDLKVKVNKKIKLFL